MIGSPCSPRYSQESSPTPQFKSINSSALCFQVWLKSNPLQLYMEVTSRFKGLDLIDRVAGELWTEVHDIVQEVGIKTIPKEKKCKKAKWLSQKALL